MKRVINVLQRGLDLLYNKGWTRYTAAIDSKGNPICVNSKNAVAYCALGVIECVTRSRKLQDIAIRALRKAIPIHYGFSPTQSVTVYNDNLKRKRQVISWFKRAIKQAPSVK